MITVAAENNNHTHCITAQPNQSASWQNNKQLLLCIGLISTCIATLFCLMGAWLILPFAGLEMAALGTALYIVSRRLTVRHVLHFEENALIIEKGLNQVQQRWLLDKQATTIHIERQQHPWDPIRITLLANRSDGAVDHIAIGDFLNRKDSQQLLQILRTEGLRIRNDSTAGQITL